MLDEGRLTKSLVIAPMCTCAGILNMNASGSKRRAIPEESADVGSDGGGGDGACRKRLCRPSPSHHGLIKQIPSELYFKIGEYLKHLDCQTLREFSIAIGQPADCLSSLSLSLSNCDDFIYNPYRPATSPDAYMHRLCPSHCSDADLEASAMEISDLFQGVPFDLSRSDVDNISFRECERESVLNDALLDFEPDASPLSGGTCIESHCPDSFFEDGFHPMTFEPFSFRGTVTHDSNHREIYSARKKRIKVIQDDAYSKLAHCLYASACEKICEESTTVRVKMRIGGEVRIPNTPSSLFLFPFHLLVLLVHLTHCSFSFPTLDLRR